MTQSIPPTLQACNVFFYYRDLNRAWAFYRDTLGLETVADYGFAKIMRVTHASYLTLVDAASGMHSADEPKSVAIALITDQLDEWYTYITEREIPLRFPFNPKADSAHDGFVALDPEGYFLEFERFNPHSENTALMPQLASLSDVYATQGTRPSHLGIKATVLWLYHRDLPKMERFYEQLLGVDLLVDQGWAKIYSIVGGGYLGLVESEKGMHKATEQSAVTVSFITADVAAWFQKANTTAGFTLRTPDITDESGLVHIFVGYDPEGYFLEWDTFLNQEPNQTLLAYLDQA
ncbi:MAG: VOC family protein [Candidatus Promineifilaceae bacterium]